ncbi:MAG: DNA internalization-related competence protein ComEC/Rec2 [Hydrogenophilales bacterium]|nr:DNA internalization-related competence protein ComEC/Rec2 [Hydrogenophilales bacterium]
MDAPESHAKRVTMRLLILAFAAGVGLLQIQPTLPGTGWLWGVAPIFLLASYLPKHGYWRQAAWLGLMLLVGFAYAAWRAEMRLADTLDPAWEGREVRLAGRVAGLPEVTPRGQRFVYRVEHVDTVGARLPGRVVLNLYDDPGKPMSDRASRAVLGGACLTLSARLYRPQGSHNPGGFDYQAWLLERGIRAQGRVSAGSVAASADCRESLPGRLDGLRETLRGRIHERLPDSPHAGIISALALGDQNAITGEQWQLFRRTGVTHLMSISGLHVTLLGWLVYTATLWGWRRASRLTLRWPARRVAPWVGLSVSVLYALLAGFGIPAQRTLFMLLAVTVAVSLDRLHSASRVLAAALFLVLVIDPWAMLSVGFWLSFGAVAALLFAGAGRLGQRHRWLAWGRAQWVVTLALLPLLLFMFQEFSLVSPMANAFAIPLISLLAVPLSIGAALIPAAWPATLASGVVEIVMTGLRWLDRLPQPVWHGAAPGLWAMLLAGVGVLVLLLPRGIPARWLGWLLILPVLMPRIDRPGLGEYRLHALDVGQGLALVLRTRNHALAYDSGPGYASGDDAGSRVVAPFLHGQGYSRLDGLVVSHDDTDHSGGALSLIASHAPGWLLSSLADPGDGRLSAHGRAILAAAERPILCVEGQSWTWDDIRFDVLYPPARYHANLGFEDNDRSCVVRVSGRHGSMLLTGDLARLGEMSLLESQRSAVASDVLIVGHHGSGSSSSPDFVAAVKPKLALISVGRANPFGHPDAAVLRGLASAGAEIWRTDRHGAIEVRLENGVPQAISTQAQQRRYWHELAAEPRQPGLSGSVKRPLNPQ